MTNLMLSFGGFITCCVICLIPGNKSSNFPLDDCTDPMDIVELFGKDDQPILSSAQIFLHNSLVRHVTLQPLGMKFPQVACAAIIDTFSGHNNNVDVSDWKFGHCLLPLPNTTYLQNITYGLGQNEQEVLKSKIKFAGSLFSEMSGVRQNADHIAVIYLECSGYSLDKARNIPGLVQQQSSDIKIFIVVFGVENLKDTIHLSDTLLLPCNTVHELDLLPMAICKRCWDMSIMFEHRNATDFLSCYHLHETGSKGKLNWFEANKECVKADGALAGIETREELHFLQTWLKQHLITYQNLSYQNESLFQYPVQVYIGLRRELKTIAKRFKWSHGKVAEHRPLVVNNWMSGQPSGGYNNAACGVWQFVWDGHKNNTNASSNGDGFDEGWVDVDCRTQLSTLYLCEFVLPRRLEDVNVMRINPASKESFTNALRRTNFKKSGNNIVSASVNIEYNKVRSLNEPESQFPIFDCGEDTYYHRYISYIYVCDSIDHCTNRRDETACLLGDPHENTCLDYDNYDLENNDCQGLYCCDDSCLLPQWVNDGEIDCTVCMKDTVNETNDENMTNITNEMTGHVNTAGKCTNILEYSCVYTKDRYGAIMGCRDVSHLEDCRDFECSEGHFKCPNSYCIPQHYVLDGNLDCPRGEEEKSEISGDCSGNFACWNSTMCLHPDLVCDGHPECPHGDDEIDCKDNYCPDGAFCVSGTFTISDYNISIPFYSSFLHNRTLKYLDVSGVELIDNVQLILQHFLENAIIIIFSNCKIRSFDDIIKYSPIRAQKIDISYNLIESLIILDGNYKTLQNLRHFNVSYNHKLIEIYFLFRYLEILDLSHTGLSYINNSFFVSFHQLKHLNLSYTFISSFPNIFFSSNFILQTLDLRVMPTSNFYENFFNGLTISQHLYTDNFEMCCPQIRGHNIPCYACDSPEDSISSCFDLVKVHVQRVLLWVVAALAVLGNMIVIVYRFIWDRSVVEAGYGLFVTNLGISDIIMGVYLSIIAGADYYYRGIYVLHDKNWRDSVVCKFSGFVATLSIEASTIFIFLITLDRFLVMKFPFGQIKLNKNRRVIALLLSWIISFLLALIPVVFKFEIYSTNAMCLGLPLTIKRPTGWEYSFGLFILYNFFMFLIIACGQIVIYRSMSQNRITRSASITVSRRPQDIMVAKQLSLVALSNFLCWFPVGIMGLLTLGEYEISNDVYAWTTVIVLPINSAVNPLIYTIPALLVKWEKYKYGDSRTQIPPT